MLIITSSILRAISFIRKGKIENNAYRACAYEVEALITQFQEALKKKYKVLKECEKLLGI